jgi:serine protease inhibitor
VPTGAASTTSFALSLLDRVGARGVVLSPSSVQMALTALRPGVSGAARAALDEVLGPAPAVREIDDPGVVLALAQALWIDADRELVADLAIDAHSLDFSDPGAVDRVNAWAADQTRGMIPIVVDAFEPDEVFALTDAAYFDGAWTEPFDPAATEPRPFTRPDGSAVDVPTMHAYGSHEYFEDDAVQAVRLPYGNTGELCFVAVIAREGLAPPRLSDWQALQTAHRPGSIALPHFHAESGLELSDALKALGLGPAFTPGSDFEGLFSGPGKKALNRVLHRARVDVDEQGTRAAAVTVVTAMATAFRADAPFELRLDRPFLWAIEDRRTATLLFLGIVTDPSQTSEEST